MSKRLGLLVIALALNSCADAVAAPVTGPCTISYSHQVEAFYFPDGGSVDAYTVWAHEAVPHCPAAGGAEYHATVHGLDITYLITWP